MPSYPLFAKRPCERQWRIVTEFPTLEFCHRDGIIALGGNYSVELLVSAYKRGIFPWPVDDVEPIYWHCPAQRFVLPSAELHIPGSLKRVLKKGPYTHTIDQAFDRVIAACASTPRAQGAGTWINDDLRRGYEQLHALGYAHSVESWEAGQLVGGLYGVCIGRMFYGESMFAHRPDASKLAFVRFAQWLARHDFPLIDCQAPTEHLARFGARLCPRKEFLARIETLTAQPAPQKASWRFEDEA